jgi:glyoxylase-like metal-dependent hydrolase (beta-lactamase superfamily II)
VIDAGVLLVPLFNPILLDAHNPGPMTGRGNNTYLLHSRPGHAAALIDAGTGDSRHLEALERELDIRQARLASVLVTHGHSDHAAGSTQIARRHPTAVFAKFPWPEEDGRYPVDWQALADGQTVDAGGETLTVLHTPGHSPDHIALWHEPARAAFVGDLVIEGGSVMIPWSRGGNLDDYLASLERLIALRPRTLFPAHGPVIADPLAVLSGHVEHRRARERQVIGALRRGHSTVPAIAESIYDGLDPALVPAARENVRAHLEKLKAGGLVHDDGEQWIDGGSPQGTPRTRR